MDLVRRVRPDIVSVTRFSARTGTPAASMENQIVGWRVKDRSRRLTRLRFEIAQEIHNRLVGREYTVLVTEAGKAGTVLARTPEYRPGVPPEAASLGGFVTVGVDGATPTDLRGHLKEIESHAQTPL